MSEPYEQFSYEDSREYQPNDPFESDIDATQEQHEDSIEFARDGGDTLPELNHEWYSTSPIENN